VSEEELVERIGALCERYGLRWAHFNIVYRGRRSLHGCYGYPDLTIAGPRGVIFRECKAQSTLRPDQRRWRDMLRRSGQDWEVWRPIDLATGRVEKELAAIA